MSNTPEPHSPSPVRLHARLLPALLGLLSLVPASAGCASTPQRRAAGRAVDQMLEELHRTRPDVAAASRGDATPVRGIVNANGKLYLDVVDALRERETGIEVLASGTVDREMLDVLARQVGDDYRIDETLLPGGKLPAELFVAPHVVEVEGGEVEVSVEVFHLPTSRLAAFGSGSSYGKLERTRRWTYFGVRCLAVPFVAIYDIGRTSTDYAFRGEKKPSFGGAVGRGLLAIVYSPVALFTSDYESTRDLFGPNG